MTDISAEPSMEEILSSIKRIIAEEGDSAPARGRRAPRDAAADTQGSDEVLELSEPMTPPAHLRRPAQTAAHVPAARAPEPAPVAEPATREPILSERAQAATRGSIEALSRLMVKPESGSDGTLEGLVREMLRPMLRDWLDANLPDLVETIVQREIAKIAGNGAG